MRQRLNHSVFRAGDSSGRTRVFLCVKSYFPHRIGSIRGAACRAQFLFVPLLSGVNMALFTGKLMPKALPHPPVVRIT